MENYLLPFPWYQIIEVIETFLLTRSSSTIITQVNWTWYTSQSNKVKKLINRENQTNKTNI